MKLTRARLGALKVLEHGPARYSNETVIERAVDGDYGTLTRLVYWQSADWLIDEGYARPYRDTVGRQLVEITALGVERLHTEQTGVTR